MAEVDPILEIEGVSKRFDATQALAEVSLTLYPGEVHSLVGENGAGKSTLIKIMTGIHPADEGAMRLSGQPFSPRNAADAQLKGVAAIYQEPSIFPDLSVAENIFIGHQDLGWVVNWSAMNQNARQILSTLDIDIDVHERRFRGGTGHKFYFACQRHNKAGAFINQKVTNRQPKIPRTIFHIGIVRQ